MNTSTTDILNVYNFGRSLRPCEFFIGGLFVSKATLEAQLKTNIPGSLSNAGTSPARANQEANFQLADKIT